MSATYATVQEIRDRGVTEDAADNAKVQSALERACIPINAYCGRNFLERQETYQLDGTGRRLMFLDDRPVVEITSLKVDSLTLRQEDYRVYRDEGYIKLVGYSQDLFTRLAGVFPITAINLRRCIFGEAKTFKYSWKFGSNTVQSPREVNIGTNCGNSPILSIGFPHISIFVTAWAVGGYAGQANIINEGAS